MQPLVQGSYLSLQLGNDGRELSAAESRAGSREKLVPLVVSDSNLDFFFPLGLRFELRM